MNSTIEKGLEEIWEEASDKWDNQKEEGQLSMCSPRSFLVKDESNLWGKPIEEIVNIVVDDIQGMPWSEDSKWEVSMSFDGYFKELRKQARKKFFDHYKKNVEPDRKEYL
jgi:hypothetical protein